MFWPTATSSAAILQPTVININNQLSAGGSISGKVFEADGTTPIPGIPVAAFGSASGSVITSPDDSCTITGLISGEYKVTIYGSGYLEEYYQGAYDSNAATLVNVTAPNDTPGIDFTIGNGGSIWGYVYEADGKTPISSATIYVVSDDGKESGIATTSLSGNYTFKGLSSGSYKVSANVNGYLRQYYNGVSSSTNATPINFGAPGHTQEVDFTIGNGGSISGHIYEPDGRTPIDAGVSVSVYSLDNGII